MARSELPPPVQQLVWRSLSSIDHVAVLLAVRAAVSGDGLAAGEAAARAAVSEDVARAVLADLVKAELLQEQPTTYRYAPDPESRAAVDQLAEMYNTRPVTLVRAIYDRPPASIRRFADAFRVRREEA